MSPEFSVADLQLNLSICGTLFCKTVSKMKFYTQSFCVCFFIIDFGYLKAVTHSFHKYLHPFRWLAVASMAAFHLVVSASFGVMILHFMLDCTYRKQPSQFYSFDLYMLSTAVQPVLHIGSLHIVFFLDFLGCVLGKNTFTFGFSAHSVYHPEFLWKALYSWWTYCCMFF